MATDKKVKLVSFTGSTQVTTSKLYISLLASLSGGQVCGHGCAGQVGEESAGAGRQQRAHRQQRR